MRTIHWFAFVVLLVAGCSPLPLPEDVTGLNTHEIIQKIRCETRTAVEAVLEHEPFGHQRATYKRDAANLKAKRQDQIALELEENVLKKERAALVAQYTEFQLTYQELEKRIEYEKTVGQRAPEGAKRRAFSGLEGEIRTVERQKAKWEVERTVYLRKAAAHNAVASKIKSDVARKELEFAKRYKKLTNFYNHQHVFLFRFQITETNTATAGGTFSMPIHLGSLKIGFGAGAERERYRERQVKVAGSFEDLLDARCLDGPVPDRHVARRYPIVGKIGVAETLHQFLHIAHGVKFQKEGESYIDELQFTTTIDAKLLPEVTLAPVPKQTLSLDADLTGKRKDLHEVIIYLAPPGAVKPPAEDKVLQVRLLNEAPHGLGPDPGN